MTGSRWLRTVPACRLEELPRPVDRWGRPLPGDPGHRQRHAALVAAYHLQAAGRGLPVVAGWWRAGGGPVTVFAGGAVLSASGAGDGADGAVRVTMPAGGRGAALAPGALSDRLAGVPCWVRLAGLTDGLLADDRPAAPLPGEEPPPSIEDCLLRAWRETFAWLLLAVPVPHQQLDEAAQQVADTERAVRNRSTPEYAVRADRLARRHRELRQAESGGLWSVHLLAGGMTPGAASAVAGLLAASVDLRGLPYALAPAAGYAGLDEALDQGVTGAPFLASSRMVAALAVAPREEIPGLRLTLPPDFDVTPETASGAGATVQIGRVLDRNRVPVEDLRVPLLSLNRHTFVCGATGSGKSQTIRTLLAQASAAGVPWLVVEPAKAEYRRMAARLGPGTVTVIRPGDPEAPPVRINPLEPAPGFPLQTHLDLVRALFLAAFEADEPFPQVLAAALTRCYEELGWDLALGEARTVGHRPRYPTLGDLQRVAEQVVTEVGYGREITDNVRGFVRVRLSSLRLGTTGRFFEGGHPVDFGSLLDSNVVVEIEDVGDDQDKAFLMGTLLVRLVEQLRTRQRARGGTTGAEPAAGLRHLTVIEEAHRLLRRSERSGPAAHAVELFAALLAEVRAYGEGLVIAEQIPGKLVPDVIKNTAVKVLHRLPARDDRDAVGATCNLTELQSQYLVTLAPGAAAVFADGMDRPLLVQVPEDTGRERPPLPPLREAGELIGRRSVLCGTDCRVTPCTLRQMRGAQRATPPWLELWAELAVLGHLTGWGIPLPRRSLLDRLVALPARQCDCLLAHAVDRAVGVRSGVLTGTAGPEDLAVHIAAGMAGVRERALRCAAEEPEWLAPPYRWVLVLDELNAAVRADPGRGPHPRTDEWNARYHRRLPAVAGAEQLELVRGWFAVDTRDRGTLATVAFGAESPSALECAVGARRADPDWSSRLAGALRSFRKCQWPHRYLAPAAAAPEVS